MTAFVLVLLLLFVAGRDASAQNLDSKGKISNMGQIIINGMLVSSGANPDGNAQIDNKGKITVGGNAVIEQDTIDGEVHYVKNDNTQIQVIPQITYSTVRFSGISRKRFTQPIPLRARDTFQTTSNSVRIDMEEDAEIITNGRVEHQGLINPDKTKGLLIMYGESAQNIDGRGVFKELELDNSGGADVINGGGFRVNNVLELKRGEFRNSPENNFKMDDGSLIVRHAESSIAATPEFGNTVSVAYAGSGTITSGPEIPSDPDVLQDMTVGNDGGLYLADNATVNRSLYVGSTIYTEPTQSDMNELTLTSTFTPVFGNPNAEIDGTFRRTNLSYDGSEIVFNNPYTYLKFNDLASAGGAREIAMRVKPNKFHQLPEGDQKVKRVFQVFAFDANGNPIDAGGNYEFGYGWRNTTNDRNETNNLTISELLLQRWTGDGWSDIETSTAPQTDDVAGWASARATGVASFGSFAIGMPSDFEMFLRAIAQLEGPYRYGSMQDDLRDLGMIPRTPPDMYPYNLDPQRPFIEVNPMPEGAIDWVVLEFRKGINADATNYRTGLLMSDGSIVGPDGVSPIVLSQRNFASGNYYVALRHRNHLAVITNDPVGVFPDVVETVVDFSDPANIYGKLNSIKPVGYRPDGSVVFGLIGGDINQDGIIDDADINLFYDYRELEAPGGFTSTPALNSDANMNGINNTVDFNVGWNNRNKRSFEK